jgi:oligopeptide transport system substrate-binding protein
VGAGLQQAVQTVQSNPSLWQQGVKKRGAGGVELGFDASLRNTRIMEKIQADLKKAFQLDVKLSSMDWRSYHRQLKTDPPALFRYAWMAPFYDPIVHLKVFQSGDVHQVSGCANAQYDRLVEEIHRLGPGPKRLEKIQLAQKILIEQEAALVPLYHYVQNTAVGPRVENFKVNSLGILQFRQMELK